jgi:cyclic pyranopterin phosphate synthase
MFLPAVKAAAGVDFAPPGAHLIAMATAPAYTRPLIEPFGRTVDYLRISVTDRCDFRCVYCMSEAMTFLPKSEVLSLEEIDRIATGFVRRGTRKLRLTGGEPLVRRGVIDLVRSLSRHLASGALDEITLTTNGSQLRKFAMDLADAGVRRINVSLDTLDAAKFARITRWGRLPQVLDGIAAASEAGLHVKINMVALKKLNDDEIEQMLVWTALHGHDLVLIETMPMGAIDEDRVDRYLPLKAVRRDLETRHTLIDLLDKTGGPARYVRIAETGQRLGFITPLTHNFCEGCNRVRLTATGQLYLCLGQDDAADLRAVIRSSDDDALLDAAIDEAISRKPKGHDFVIDRAAPAVARHMSVTGG